MKGGMGMDGEASGSRAGGASAGGASGSARQDSAANASMYARRFQCSAETVRTFAAGCRRKNDGIDSMCSLREHEMEDGQEIYFWDGSGKNLPTAYCSGLECFLGELHESTIFHACGKRLISGMMVCQTCSYKSDIEGGMAQCEAEGHVVKSYKTKQEYKKDHSQDGGEESHTFYAYQILQSQRFATLWDTESVWYYENGVYRDHGEVLVRMLVEKQVENCTTHMRTEVLNTIRATTVVRREKFDAVPGVVNVRNGLLALDGMEFGPHDPDHLSRVQIDARYDPDAVAEKFTKFLEEVIPDREDRETLLEVVSTALAGGLVNLEKILMFLGEGHNGKSTLLEVIASVVGQDNISHVSIHQIIEERFARAELDGKLMNIYADISSGEITHLGVIKSLVTGEPIAAEFKGQPMFHMRNRAKLIFSANRLPDIAEDSDAVFRRFIIINFPVQFDGDRDNPRLKEELTTEAERSGILNILLDALRRVIDNGGRLTHAKTIDAMRDMWRTQSDHIKRFTVDCLRREEGSRESKDDVYQAYVLYCRFVKEKPSEQQRFSRRLSSLGFRHGKARVRGRAVNAWYDVRIQVPESVSEAEDGGDGGGGGDDVAGSDGGGGGDGGLLGGGGRGSTEPGNAGADSGAGMGAVGGGDGTLRVGGAGGPGEKDGTRRPGGRDGIALDVLGQLCEAAAGTGGLARRSALADELGKTGLFPAKRDVETVVGRLVEGGWIVDIGGNDNDKDNDKDNETVGAGAGAASGGGGGGGNGGADTGNVGGHTSGSGGNTGGCTNHNPANTGGRTGGTGGTGGDAKAPAPAERMGRRFRCQRCPAGPFDEYEVGFGGKRLLDYHTGDGHRIEWVDP